MNERPSLRVVRVIARLNIGGPARHAVILNEGLQHRGFRTLLVHGVTGQGEGSLECLVTQGGLPALKLESLTPAVRPYSDLSVLASLVRLMFAERPDVVHTHTAKAGALGRTAALVYNATRGRSRRALVVHTFHGNVLEGYFGGLGSVAARMAERVLANVTDQIVTISPRQRSEIVDRFRIAPAARVAVVPLGLELGGLLSMGEDGPSLRAELGLPPGAIVFGYIGRLVPIKDVPTLLGAFARVRAEVPDARLLVVGDGERRQGLAERARELGIADATRFLGWQTDLVRVYRSIDIAILSSINEGTPVSVIEAMAAARAVVATDVGGVADVITDGETGILVPSRSVERLSEAMVRLARQPGERRRLGLAARRTVGRFRAERLVDDVERLYREGLARKRGFAAAGGR